MPLTIEDALPCPFCGGTAEIEPWHGGPPTKRRIACAGDDCSVVPAVCGDTEEIAVSRWNVRLDLASRASGEGGKLLIAHMALRLIADAPEGSWRDAQSIANNALVGMFGSPKDTGGERA